MWLFLQYNEYIYKMTYMDLLYELHKEGQIETNLKGR